MPHAETVARGFASADRWLTKYFSDPDRPAVSESELRLMLCWLANRNRPAGGLRDVALEAVALDRFELTPERVRLALISTPNAMAYRILREFETVAATAGMAFDPAVLEDDRRMVRDRLVESFHAEAHVARREILLQLIEQEEYAAISTTSDFWADFLCHDVELAHLLGPDREAGADLAAYSQLIDLLLFKYISLRDIDRLCPVLRAARTLSPAPSLLAAQGIALVSRHCFERGGAVAHAAAFHFSKSKSGSDLDLDSSVILKTTISTLVTLAEFGGAAPLASQAEQGLLPLPREQDGGDVAAAMRAAEARAVGWLENSIGAFDPFCYADSDKFEFSIKMLAELAFVCATYHSSRDNPNRGRIETLRTAIFERALRRPGLWSFLMQNLSTLPGFSLYASMLECGFIDEELHRKLGSLSDQPNIVHGEYAPALFMDIAHSVIRSGFAWKGPSMRALYERSLLAARPDLLCLKDPDYYTITHTIFFVTDFGRHPEQLPRNARTFFAEQLEKMTFFFAARENWDLLGEILLCQIYLNLDHTAGFSRYLRLLLSTQNPDGSFVSELSAREGEDGKANPWTDLLDRYHTTLVFLLLAAAERNTAAAASPPLALV